MEGEEKPEPVPVAKKKPGRPKKKVEIVPIETHGIMDKPAQEGDLLEMVYHNPALFKKLLHVFKNYAVSEIEIIFGERTVLFTAKDHLGKSTIYETINCACMNFYYCAKPTRICVRRNNLEKILGTLGRSHYKITFILKEDYRSILYLHIQDMDYNITDAYEIEVIFKPAEAALLAPPDDSEYPIKFKISSKHFKTRVNSIQKLSPTLVIQKSGDNPLQLTFDKIQPIGFTGIYNDPQKMELKADIAPDDVFCVSVQIDYVRPFSNANIGDEVIICADKQRRISFTTMLDRKGQDWAAHVKIFTEIKDFKREIAK